MSIPQDTTVPAALAFISSGLTTAVDDASVPVLYGLPTQWPEGDCVCIAVTVPGRPGVEHHLPKDPRTQGYNESYEILCAVWSWGDDPTDMDSRSVAAGDLLDVVKDFLRANKTLGGIVIEARVGESVGWVPKNRGDGCEVTIGFSIHVIASI